MSEKDDESRPFLDRDVDDSRTNVNFFKSMPVDKPNFSYIFTSSGILNVFQLLGSTICLAITLYHCQPKYKGKYGSFIGNYQELFFLLTNFGCITCVMLHFLCNTISMRACNDIGRTIMGIVLNSGLCALSIFATFLFFQSIETKFKEVYANIDYDWKMGLSIVGFINAAIYGLGIVDAYKLFGQETKPKLKYLPIKKLKNLSG